MVRSKKNRRNISGVLLLDKPLGMSSNQALQKARYLFNAAKAGHTGSLDPLATGLLPLCFGEATKVSSYLLDSDKFYTTVARLGARSTTGDAEGELIDLRSVPELDEARIREVLSSFMGEIDQVPPMYSALKHEGKRLYELARQGVEVERKSRRVQIFQLDLLGWDQEHLRLQVGCSKGTYIRSLVEDIGEALGCGAHVVELRRTGVKPYVEPEMWSIEQLERLAEDGPESLDQCLIPVDSALVHIPAVHMDEEEADKIAHGQPVVVDKRPDGLLYRLYRGERTFIGLGMPLDDDQVAPKRLIFNG
ncbi:MAG: tRNA pseudouridine(55) synthase TruB [Gammaproteobacteria bacterium]|nr:tRNA pseudouridine(55) synthase TruB [Gammaproteobacteria bacterium]